MAGEIRVLHVDDDPDFLDVTATFLEREDERLTVETATSADDGLDRLAEGGVDCVVSDYNMPGRDGIAFLRAVRADDPDLPFVLFTGRGSEEVASDAISADVTDYLQKGVGTEQYAILANRIGNAVEGHRARAAIEASERRLRRVYERITDGFFAVNADWRYTYVNEEGARLVGRSPDELLGETVRDAFPGIGDTPFDDPLRAAMETQETTTVEAYYPPHDTWYDARIYPTASGISIYFREASGDGRRARARRG